MVVVVVVVISLDQSGHYIDSVSPPFLAGFELLRPAKSTHIEYRFFSLSVVQRSSNYYFSFCCDVIAILQGVMASGMRGKMT